MFGSDPSLVFGRGHPFLGRNGLRCRVVWFGVWCDLVRYPNLNPLPSLCCRPCIILASDVGIGRWCSFFLPFVACRVGAESGGLLEHVRGYLLESSGSQRQKFSSLPVVLCSPTTKNVPRCVRSFSPPQRWRVRKSFVAPTTNQRRAVASSTGEIDRSSFAMHARPDKTRLDQTGGITYVNAGQTMHSS